MPEYQVGDVVNGHRFNGQEWIPIDPDEATATPSSPPPPPSPTTPQPQYIAVRTAPVKVPGTAALVLSILGFCGVTAILGIVLGLTSRSQAKRAGLPTGKSTAAIVIGALWLLPLALGPVIAATTGGNSTTSAPPAAMHPHRRRSATTTSPGAPGSCARTTSKSNSRPPQRRSSRRGRLRTSPCKSPATSWGWSPGSRPRTPSAPRCGPRLRAAPTTTRLATATPCWPNWTPPDVPQATGADTGQAPQVLTALRKRGFTCTGPQGKFDLYQCRKGTIQDATYGEMPRSSSTCPPRPPA